MLTGGNKLCFELNCDALRPPTTDKLVRMKMANAHKDEDLKDTVYFSLSCRKHTPHPLTSAVVKVISRLMTVFMSGCAEGLANRTRQHKSERNDQTEC